MKNLLSKNIKFALLVSLASGMGMQTSQAVSITCPKPDKIEIVGDKTAQEIKLKAETTGDRKVNLTGTSKGGVRPRFFTFGLGQVEKGKIRSFLKCYYSFESKELSFSFALKGDQPIGLDCENTAPNSDTFNCTEKK